MAPKARVITPTRHSEPVQRELAREESSR